MGSTHAMTDQERITALSEENERLREALEEERECLRANNEENDELRTALASAESRATEAEKALEDADSYWARWLMKNGLHEEAANTAVREVQRLREFTRSVLSRKDKDNG